MLGLLDVLEAEARSLRMGFLRVVSALLVLAAAGVFVLAAPLFSLWAAYTWLSPWLGVPLAALAVSLFSLLAGAGLWWRARALLR